jgi:hypothetical protein
MKSLEDLLIDYIVKIMKINHFNSKVEHYTQLEIQL